MQQNVLGERVDRKKGTNPTVRVLVKRISKTEKGKSLEKGGWTRVWNVLKGLEVKRSTEKETRSSNGVKRNARVRPVLRHPKPGGEGKGEVK